jgi:threonine dehydratase
MTDRNGGREGAGSGDGTTVTFADVEAARDRLDDDLVVKRTPVEYSRSLSERVDAEVHLKMEHLQWTGSFKTRGAFNKLSRLAAETDVDRVVAASAGNHAQGVALAATRRGIASTVVMPTTAPQAKVDATREYGAEVVLEGSTFQAATRHAESLAGADDTAFVHAYDDPAIVAGQGTLGLELYEDVPEVDTVVAPIGGGGLIGGVAVALDRLDPSVRVVGVQCEGAETVPQSLEAGEPVSREQVDTIADGIATGGLSALTFGLISEYVDEVVIVDDDDIARAILTLLQRAKQVVEGAGAASVAALLSEGIDVSGETVVPLLCGGNLDMTMLRTIVVHALTAREQLVRLRVRITDRPGTMEELSGIVADHGANIRTVRHDREVEDLRIGEAYLDFQLETAGHDHTERIVRSIERHGYRVRRLN